MDRAATRHDRPRRRLAVALAVALAVHAAFVVFALRRTAPTVAPETITIELRTIDRAPPRPLASAPAPVVEPTPRPKQAPRRLARTAPKRAEPAPAPLANAAPAPAPAPAPAREAGRPSSSSGALAVNLFPLGSIANGNLAFRESHGDDAADGFDEAEPQGDGPAAERARVAQRIGRGVADGEAHSRVEAGLVDPYFASLGHAAKRAFQPSVSTLGGKDGDGPAAGASNMLGTWGAAGKQWAKSGSPYPDGEKPTGLVDTHEVRRDPAGNSGFDGADFLARWNAGDFAAPGYQAVVELVQDSKGAPLRTRIVASSGSREFDAAARHAIELAASGRPAPAHGFGLGGKFIRSRWKVEAKYVTQTAGLAPDPTGASRGAGFLPGLTMGGTMDLGTGEAHADVPGTTRVITRVTLLAVYGGEATPRAE